jgi:glycosyltransferase A (GT-A) superfamily protein (DUF2064 family)
MTTLIVIAKEPLPGRAKTRLHPPLSLEQAAEVAAAAIDDTLTAVASVPASRRVLLYAGDRVPASAAGYDVVAQSEGGLDERLAAGFDACAGPTLLIGMDTPQVRARDLARAFDTWPDDIDAWFGPALDGGFWALGMREPRGDLIRGVPMSHPQTGARQRRRLIDAGLRIGTLATLRDVDTFDDAVAVAALAPQTATARLIRSYRAAAVA